MMNAVLDNETRIEHMEYAKAYGPKPLKDKWGRGRISIVGYGPSLRDTWQDIKGPIMATSGAMEFLEDRGVKVDYYVALDPRVHKCYWLRKPTYYTTYLMASVVCPFSWAMLDGCDTYQWHAKTLGPVTDWVMANDPETCRLKTGSTVGVAALRLAWWMGWREFDLYGMDHTEGYAGDCPNPGQPQTFYKGMATTPQLVFSAYQMKKSMLQCNATVHGPSLLHHIDLEDLQSHVVYQEGSAKISINNGQVDPAEFLQEMRARAAGEPYVPPVVLNPPRPPHTPLVIL